MDSRQSIVDTLNDSTEPTASGQVQCKSFEIAVAMRESAR